MKKVLRRVSFLVFLLYLFVGTFGYLTFATDPENQLN